MTHGNTFHMLFQDRHCLKKLIKTQINKGRIEATKDRWNQQMNLQRYLKCKKRYNKSDRVFTVH